MSPRRCTTSARHHQEGETPVGDGGHVSADRRDPAETLSRALVAVVEANGWHVAGGLSESAPPDRIGRCVPRG